MNYQIIRSKRKTISISIDKNGSVIVRAPMKLPESTIMQFVDSKSDWIEKHTSIVGSKHSRRLERLSQPPEELPLLGGMCPVVHTAPYGYRDGCFHLPDDASLEQLLPYLRKLYSSIAKETLIARTQLTADRMGITITQVKVNSAKTRWGSCSAKKTVNLSWKLIAADLKLIDYVIVHELCHTKQMNHSAAFWENVAAVIPDYKERRDALTDVQNILSEFGLD